MSLPDLSVLMPVRDGGPHLERAVSTVLASRGVRLELVAVDDGSSDETPQLLAQRSRRDPRLRVLRTRPDGIVAALNRGLALCRAPLVARMDADDEVHPERFAAQRRLLLERPELGLAGCLVESFREGGLGEGYRIYTEWVNGLRTPQAIAREAFVECPVPHPTWMFRTNLARGLGGYRDRAWPEDLDLLYRILASGQRVEKVPRVLHRWRDHAGRLSRVDGRYTRESFARAKAHFLGRLHPMSGAVVWGAGRTGRRMVRLLEAEAIPTQALLDINPARTGTNWREIPILAPERLRERGRRWRDAGLRILGAVASRGARGQIRRELAASGLSEGADFLMVA